jgi:aminoglycoside phosphotransferase family enzyme/predicted kinase
VERQALTANSTLELAKFDRLVERLRNADAFGHSGSTVSVIETHISAVLLAGEYAYKIKKPVNFGFVDFSTLEKRRQFCEEEIRLNSRFAPDLYLAVVPIYGNAQSPTFEPDGPAIEYAVKMRRFDQDVLLDRCIRRKGLITAAKIEAFAVDISAIHAAADMAGPKTRYGRPEVVAANLRGCRGPIQAAGLLDSKPAAERLFDYTEGWLNELNPWFEHRLRHGHVRECHGDLHLGNLIMANGRIEAFDCIEFNPDLRWIDVANDIAFFTMDLRFHGETGFARRFRNAYLDAAGDYSLLRVLRFYEVYRALVRAMVAALRESEKSGAGIQDAVAHLALAQELASERPVVSLVITHGLSGSGKTFVSSKLVAASEAIRIRSDVERNRSTPDDGARYSDRNIDRVYEHLAGEAREVIAAGHPVVVDATFLKRSHRDRFRHLAEEFMVPFRVLDCQAPKEELHRRISARIDSGIDASEADHGVLGLQLRQREPLAEDERPFVVPSGGTQPLARLVAALGLDVEPRG